MATTYDPRAASSSSRFQRLANSWLSFFVPGDIIALIVLTALLLVPPLSLGAAEWPLHMDLILAVTGFSAVFGLILSRSQFNELLALVISTTYGLCFVLLMAAITVEGNLTSGVYAVFLRAVTWVVDAMTGGINQDNLVFTLLVATLFWFLGYNAAWHTFRIDRVWRVIVPPGLILITNAIFYSGSANLEWYLVAFLFLSLIMIARSNLRLREQDWLEHGVRIPRQMRGQFLRAGAVLAMVVLLVGWTVPQGDLQDRLDRFQQFLQSDPLSQMAEFWNRLFTPLETEGPTTADYYGSDTLELGGAIRLGEQTVFTVEAPPTFRYYWRSRVFDTYEAGRWTSAPEFRVTDSVPPLELDIEQTLQRVPVEQTFTIELNATRILYAAPQPYRIEDVATRTDLFYTAPENDPGRDMSVSVIRPTRVIRQGGTYAASSFMSTATANDLRGAGTDYPEWIANRYLYVSNSVTQRTRDLAREVVMEAGATDPYDQAKAIERFLRQHIVYDETIPSPPRGQDPVDWVLFDFQRGYCNYYASAMIVMLRELGIPARMAAGFAQGNYNSELGEYVVTERDAHTWVEAYFPGYGWIEFEPTAAQAPLQREGDEQVSQNQVAPPQVTATPTFTPTSPPTPTPNPTEPPPDSQDDSAADAPTATITPTFTPTPTATPVIVPTQPAPSPPPTGNPLELILPALGLLLLGLFVLLLLIALATFIYWWWEWRGMGGLSPVARAYARLERYLALLGLRLGGDQTPEERRRYIVRRLPTAERAVTAITRMYTTERYGPGLQQPTDNDRRAEAAGRAWTDARRNILQRWLARLAFWRSD